MEYAKELTPLKEVAALKESKNVVATEGIISGLEEKTTKQGKKYVTGKLTCKDISVPFKKWDCSLEEFKEQLPKTRVVQGFGNAQVYEGEIQIILSGVAESQANPNLFINSSLFNPKEMMDAILGDLRKEVAKRKQNKEGNIWEEDVLEYVEFIYDALYCAIDRYKSGTNPLMYFPYGESVHSEKGGLLYHVYNVVGALSPVGLPKKRTEGGYICAVDTFIVKAAVAVYRLYILDYFIVDEETGTITGKDEVRYKLEGKTHIIDLLRFVEEQCKYQRYNPMVLNFKHCVLALNGLVEPATPEALLALNRVRAELDLARATEKDEFITTSDLLIREDQGEGNLFPYLGGSYIK